MIRQILPKTPPTALAERDEVYLLYSLHLILLPVSIIRRKPAIGVEAFGLGKIAVSWGIGRIVEFTGIGDGGDGEGVGEEERVGEWVSRREA